MLVLLKNMIYNLVHLIYSARYIICWKTHKRYL